MDSRFAPNRYGYPQVLCEPAVPITTDAIPIFPTDVSLMTIFNPIFQQQDVRLFRIDICQRAHRDPRATVLFFASIRMVDAFRIQKCLDDIIRKCHEFAVDLPIEIMDYQYTGRTTFVVTPEEANNWIEVSSQLFDKLRSTCPKYNFRFETIDLLRRGDSNDNSSTRLTIVIGSPDADNYLWTHIVEELQYLAPRYDVEVVYSNGVLLMNDREEKINMSAYGTNISIGAGVSKSGESKGGTIGGQIELEIGGELCLFALTSHHVAVDEALQTANGKHNALYPHSSLLQNDANTYNSPSDKDHQIRIYTLTVDKSFWQDCIQEYQANQRIPSKKLQEAAACLSAINQDISTTEQFERCMGSLAAASGRRFLSRPEDSWSDPEQGCNLLWFMDWAILKMDPRRRIDNMIKDLRIRGGETNLRNGRSAEEWANLRIGLQSGVAFRGRTSGWVLGHVNPAVGITTISPGMTRDENDIAKGYDIPEYSKAYCWTFVNRDPKADTVRGGDSGSVVLLDEEYKGDARWVGLVFGGGGARQGYMTPISLILDDIVTVMGGAKVILPAVNST